MKGPDSYFNSFSVASNCSCVDFPQHACIVSLLKLKVGKMKYRKIFQGELFFYSVICSQKKYWKSITSNDLVPDTIYEYVFYLMFYMHASFQMLTLQNFRTIHSTKVYILSREYSCVDLGINRTGRSNENLTIFMPTNNIL